ncbi:MAG TPA: hypothetical protein VM290_11245 [Gaiellaceae bacterium]|jgi:hypothetical protein|nr:hypothetical protein [Gaiellaceae bacterium]
MAGESKTTTDHDEIRRWVEERGGKPARVADTGSGNDPGILRIDFPGRGDDDRLEEISWEDWFEAFEENELAFVYQEETSDGDESRFSKLVSR